MAMVAAHRPYPIAGAADKSGGTTEGDHQNMRSPIVVLAAALALLSVSSQAGAAKSHLKCGSDALQCGNLAKVCNPKNGKCCCAAYGTYH